MGEPGVVDCAGGSVSVRWHSRVGRAAAARVFTALVPRHFCDIHHELDAGWNVETLDVRDTSGRPLLWMGKGPWVERVVTPPELSLAVGPEQCASIPSGCTLASQYAIDFTRGGLTERLAYGTHQERDGYIFVHAGCDIGTVAVDGCYDGAPAGVTALMWAAPAAAP
jgi:hypothetical protein